MITVLEVSHLTDIDEWKPHLYIEKKMLTCIMRICAEHQNAANITASQVSLNTVKTIGREMESFNGGYETLACYDCLRT